LEGSGDRVGNDLRVGWSRGGNLLESSGDRIGDDLGVDRNRSGAAGKFWKA
jgi:hypothetical protein